MADRHIAASSALNTLYSAPLPKCWSLDSLVPGRYAAALTLPSIPEPSVYISSTSGFLRMSSCSVLASSLVVLISTLALSVHHGGQMNGSIVPIFSVSIGNCCRVLSKLD